MTTPRSTAARQRAHWDGVLGADNIAGQPTALTPRDLARETAFVRTPDFRLLLGVAGRHRGGLVVDLGGGLGLHAVALARAGHRVLVADVSGARLRALRQTLATAGLADQVLLLQTAAEHLALGAASVGVLWTHSVLIHTDLDESMREIARCLGPEGDAVLCEPTTANPLVNLYRRHLAPKEWEGITRYFTPQREALALAALSDSRTERLYVLTFLAFVWQYAVKSVWLFRLSLALLHPLDRLLMAAWPGYRRRAWFAVICGRGRRQ